MSKNKYKGIEIITSTKSGERFRAEVRVNGKRFRKTFKTVDQALTWKNSVQAEREKNKIYGIQLNNGLYFEDLCHFFLESKAEIRKSSEKTYKSAIRSHLAIPLGRKKIKDINLQSMDSIKSNMIKKKHTPGGINKIITLLNSIMKFGVSRGFVDRNPFEGYRKLKIDVQKYEYWVEEQINYFLNQVKDDFFFLVFFFALNTGMRRGEICGLQWTNFHWISEEKARITFSEQLTPSGERQGLKGHTSRTLTLNKALSKLLYSIRKESGYVFQDKRGNPINPDHLSRLWKEAQIKAGVKKIIKFHGARHSYASYLASKGVSLQTIGKILGHKDSKVTQIYSHLSQADVDKVTLETVFIGEMCA